MDKLLVATTNTGKLKEFQVLLKNLPIILVSLKDIGINKDVKETCQTFKDNAVLKAREYCQMSNLPTIADDGGLEIDALSGQPGVHSRRWFGYRMNDQELINTVMSKLKNVPEKKRTARMRTIVALAFPNNPEVKTFEGVIEVVIAIKPSNKTIPGYPYRSLMYLPKQKKYFVDISFKEQSKFSHRGRAVQKLIKYLKG